MITTPTHCPNPSTSPSSKPQPKATKGIINAIILANTGELRWISVTQHSCAPAVPQTPKNAIKPTAL